jgi:hypothetical protein
MRKNITLFILLTLSASISFAQISKEKVVIALKSNLNNQNFATFDEIDLAISSSYTSKHNGITHVYGNQLVNGLEVFNANADMHFNTEGKLISLHHNFIDNAKTNTLNKAIKVDPSKALQLALGYDGILVAQSALNKSQIIENGKFVFSNPSVSTEKMLVKTGYWIKEGKILPVHQVEFLNDETGDWWNTKVDANTGEIIEQLNYTTRCSPEEIYHSGNHTLEYMEGEEEVFGSLKKKATTGTYNAFPLPIESPIHGPRQLLSNMHTASASPFGWHDTDGVVGPNYTVTRGNNVVAKEDTLANNSANGYSPNGGDSLLFDFPYDIKAKPRANLDAAITNLFYMNNVLHDVLFEYGFDEESGNFQYKNYSGLGRQRDAVNAEAQDGSGTSNANFSTPVDGSSGRMQMFLWPTSAASSSNTLGILHPLTVDGNYYGLQSAPGPRLSPNGLPGQIVLVKDSGATTNNACGVIANAAEINGKIALIDRGGSCGTQNSVARTKIKKLQALGAIGVIIANNSSTTPPTAVTGVDNTITIPSISISLGTGVMLKSALETDSVYAVLFDSSAFNPAPIYDSDFDNGIIAHELGHGVSNRLTGGPQNSSCLGNQEQAGEGWSDFFTLAFTTKAWENGNNAARGIGTYVQDEDTTGLGIRPYRYSRNMTINPVTYNSVRTLSVPHGVGFVFCSMLYDIFWDMVDVYGYDNDLYNGKGGNNKTIQLVIDGLKLQPCQPGFVDSRNAILLADSINNGGANKDLLWKAFARRGLGFSALQGSSNSRTDGTQAFNLPPVAGLNSEAFNNNFNVYPNPTKTSFTIDVFDGASLEKTEIYDLGGKLIQTISNQTKVFNSQTIDINLQTGYYLLKIYASNGIACKKLIVE